MTTIQISLAEVTEEVKSMLLARANIWGCSPNEAAARILIQRAKRERWGKQDEPEEENQTEELPAVAGGGAED